MDLSWEICEAFLRLGYLPPATFADLPRMAGYPQSDEQRATMEACAVSLETAAERHEARAGYMRRNAESLREWSAES